MLPVLVRSQMTRQINASCTSTGSPPYFFKEAYTFFLAKKIMQPSLLLEQMSFLCQIALWILTLTNTQSAKHGHWRYSSGCISQLEGLAENLLSIQQPKWYCLLAGFHLLPEAGKLLQYCMEIGFELLSELLGYRKLTNIWNCINIGYLIYRW